MNQSKICGLVVVTKSDKIDEHVLAVALGQLDALPLVQQNFLCAGARCPRQDDTGLVAEFIHRHVRCLGFNNAGSLGAWDNWQRGLDLILAVEPQIIGERYAYSSDLQY